jgi:hypothetical protein
MISAPNRRPPSNGNRLWIALFTLLIAAPAFSSCELFKKLPDESSADTRPGDQLDPIQGSRVYDPVTGTYIIVEQTPTEPVDTIRWTDVPETAYPPITSTAGSTPATPAGGSNPVTPVGTGKEGSQLLSSYNVAVVLPFLTDRFAASRTIDANSNWALHFYGGVQMALDELSAQGVPLNVSVLDSKADERAVAELARGNRDLTQAHLVIGPYRRDNVALLANQFRTTGQVIVSPHSAASNVSDGNPNYVQVSPTLESHCQAIMKHAFANYRRDQIVLVAQDDPNEIARFKYFQDEYRRLTALRDTNRLRELVIRDKSVTMGSVNLQRFIQGNDETVFILPSWDDEQFVYAFLRKLDISKTQFEKVIVYGMPQWMNYEIIDFEFYEKLNVHVSSSTFLNPVDAQIQSFKSRYFDRFGAVPNEEAFVGYDVTRYFGKMIHKHGTRFQFQLETEPEQMLSTRYAFERVVRPAASPGGGENPVIDRWENKYLNILVFRDYQFQLAE